jgi:Lon protease-like protein
VRVSVRQLPLFPLPLVLFPGVPLPLHIFEPRYRELLADTLAGDRCFGVLYRDEKSGDDPQRGHVGCIAHIEETEELEDGRANILVAGTQRFRLERVVEAPQRYQVGAVSTYADLPESQERLAPLAARVRALFERVGRAARTLANDRDALPVLPDDPAMLSFAIASLIDLDAPARQRMLVSRSPLGRLQTLDDLLAPAVDVIEMRASVHTRAKSNGHGPHPSP